MFANKLELQYGFNDKSRYMDAQVRNTCEKEILSLIRLVAGMLDVKLLIYSDPCQKESGYSDVWSIAGRDKRAISVVLNIVMRLLTHAAPSSDAEEAVYQKDKLKKMTDELRQAFCSKGKGLLIPHGFIPQLSLLPQVASSKAAVYEAVRYYPKITRIVLRELNADNRSRSGSLEVTREHFARYACPPARTAAESAASRQVEMDKRQLSLNLFPD